MRQEQKNELVSKKFEINSACYQQTGGYHLQSQGECEDAILTIEEQKLRFYGLADGQGGKCYGASGGKACLQVLANYIQDQGVEQVMNYPFQDELPCTIMKQIRACILDLAQKNGRDFSEYASTLLAIAVNPVSGRYVFFHLGDGGLIGIRKEQDIILLSPPENGFTPQYTWLTTSHHAVSHLRIGFGSIQNMKRLVLFTDGANCLCHGKNIPHQAKKLLCAGSQSNILKYLNDSNPLDDSSCIILDFENLKMG